MSQPPPQQVRVLLDDLEFCAPSVTLKAEAGRAKVRLDRCMQTPGPLLEGMPVKSEAGGHLSLSPKREIFKNLFEKKPLTEGFFQIKLSLTTGGKELWETPSSTEINMVFPAPEIWHRSSP